jgi:hypothetical protein
MTPGTASISRTDVMGHDRDRVISISLSEAEWQAFVARQPRPVDWVRARILDEVARDSLAASPEPEQRNSQFTSHNLQS